MRGKTKKIIKPSYMIDNVRIVNRRVIANEFNNYFTSIASKLNESLMDMTLEDSAIKSFHEFLGPSISKSIILADCNEDEVFEIIGRTLVGG